MCDAIRGEEGRDIIIWPRTEPPIPPIYGYCYKCGVGIEDKPFGRYVIEGHKYPYLPVHIACLEKMVKQNICTRCGGAILGNYITIEGETEGTTMASYHVNCWHEDPNQRAIKGDPAE